MTDEQLGAIKARLAAATPGRWQPGIAGRCNVVAFDMDDVVGIAYVGSFPNIDFIVHAPEDIAQLVAEVDRLRAKNAALRAKVLGSTGICICADGGPQDCPMHGDDDAN